MDFLAGRRLLAVFLDSLGCQPAVLVRVAAAEGSTPRGPGTWMAVFGDRLVGTVGGGQVEYQAVARARALLVERRPAAACPAPLLRLTVRYALGPSLGQCCGGVMHLAFTLVGADDAPALAAALAPVADSTGASGYAPVALFGGGHVAQALMQVLGMLPFNITWIDSREGIFPAEVAQGVVCEHSEPVQEAVAGLAAGSRVLVMSFSHAEDFAIVQACLLRQRQRADLPYMGLIGSRTKWATFRSRLAERGFAPKELARITCPIGVAGIGRKEPEVIAVAVAAQLLQTLDGAAAP